MDLTMPCYIQRDQSVYEKRFGKMLLIAIMLHLLLAWHWSKDDSGATPALPDWMEIKLVAGLETPIPATAQVPSTIAKPEQQQTEVATNNRQPEPVTNSRPNSAQNQVRNKQAVQVQDNPKPVYPAAARKRGIQGTVLLELNVSARGKVTQINLKKSSGFRILDMAAINGVQQWHFIPAEEDEQQIASIVTLPVRFVLDGI